MIDDFTLRNYQFYTSLFTLNIGTKDYNRIHTSTLTNIHPHLQMCCEVFYDDIILLTGNITNTIGEREKNKD